MMSQLQHKIGHLLSIRISALIHTLNMSMMVSAMIRPTTEFVGKIDFLFVNTYSSTFCHFAPNLLLKSNIAHFLRPILSFGGIINFPL